jgi:hypothetical protein
MTRMIFFRMCSSFNRRTGNGWGSTLIHCTTLTLTLTTLHGTHMQQPHATAAVPRAIHACAQPMDSTARGTPTTVVAHRNNSTQTHTALATQHSAAVPGNTQHGTDSTHTETHITAARGDLQQTQFKIVINVRCKLPIYFIYPHQIDEHAHTATRTHLRTRNTLLQTNYAQTRSLTLPELKARHTESTQRRCNGRSHTHNIKHTHAGVKPGGHKSVTEIQRTTACTRSETTHAHATSHHITTRHDTSRHVTQLHSPVYTCTTAPCTTRGLRRGQVWVIKKISR